MRSLDELLMEAATMHRGCVCPGQVLGVRMAMLGCRLLGIDEPTRDNRLIVYVEIDRCMADAIAAVTGCRLGKRTLKYIDYGKCACSFVDIRTTRAVRILARDTARSQVWRYASSGLDKKLAQREAYKVMPDDELFFIQKIGVNIPDYDLPGEPFSRAVCNICNEEINDMREVRRNGQVLCRACAQGAYYQELK
jgi:formylmethanofuran dehydrogenase subunit E